MSTPFSATIRLPPGVTIAEFVSTHMPTIQRPPGRTGGTPDVLPFGHNHHVVTVIAPDVDVAARLLEEALGPDGAVVSRPAPLLFAVPVAR